MSRSRKKAATVVILRPLVMFWQCFGNALLLLCWKWGFLIIIYMSPQKIPPKGLALLFIGVAMAVLLVVIGKQKCSYFSFGYCSHLQHSWVRYPNGIKLNFNFWVWFVYVEEKFPPKCFNFVYYENLFLSSISCFTSILLLIP